MIITADKTITDSQCAIGKSCRHRESEKVGFAGVPGLVEELTYGVRPVYWQTMKHQTESLHIFNCGRSRWCSCSVLIYRSRTTSAMLNICGLSRCTTGTFESAKNNVHPPLVHSAVSIFQAASQQGHHLVLQWLQGDAGISGNTVEVMRQKCT